MRVNIQLLESLGACEEGHRNFMVNCKDFDGSIAESMDLPLVPYSDKVWLLETIVDKSILDNWAILCYYDILSRHDDFYFSNNNSLALLAKINKYISNQQAPEYLYALDALKYFVRYNSRDDEIQQQANLEIIKSLLA